MSNWPARSRYRDSASVRWMRRRRLKSDRDQGRHQYLINLPEQKDRILRAYVELASAKPVPRQRFRPVDAAEKVEIRSEPGPAPVPDQPPGAEGQNSSGLCRTGQREAGTETALPSGGCGGEG